MQKQIVSAGGISLEEQIKFVQAKIDLQNILSNQILTHKEYHAILYSLNELKAIKDSFIRKMKEDTE
jgi:uncharacterized protein YjcR